MYIESAGTRTAGDKVLTCADAGRQRQATYPLTMSRLAGVVSTRKTRALSAHVLTMGDREALLSWHALHYPTRKCDRKQD